jgi:hypothetical protein
MIEVAVKSVRVMKYRQCVLQKSLSETSILVQTSWIPEQFAVQGLILKLREEDGWEVAHVGSACEESDAPNYRMLVRSHRRNTGDSLPKIGI